MIDARACRMLRDIVGMLGNGHHIFEHDYVRIEVNKRQGFTTVWLHLPNGRVVLAAFGDPGKGRGWRCPDPDATAYALHTIEQELGDEILYVEVVEDG